MIRRNLRWLEEAWCMSFKGKVPNAIALAASIGGVAWGLRTAILAQNFLVGGRTGATQVWRGRPLGIGMIIFFALTLYLSGRALMRKEG